MTAPSRTGSITSYAQDDTSDSDSITVPEDAELCIVAVAYWNGSQTELSTLTLDGDAFTEVALYNSGGNNYGAVGIYQLVEPSTGEQTLAWEWDHSFAMGGGESYVMFVLFYTDVNTAGPITDADIGHAWGVATSGSFSSSTNDTCFCVGYSYGQDCDAGHGPNQVELDNDHDSVWENWGAIGEKAGVTGTTTMAADGDGTAIAACSIAGTGGAGTIGPAAMHDYRRRRV